MGGWPYDQGEEGVMGDLVNQLVSDSHCNLEKCRC